MKADCLWAFKQAPSRGDGEIAQPPDPLEGADAPEFARALDGQSVDDSPTQEIRDGDSQFEWENGFRSRGRQLDAAGNRLNAGSASSASHQTLVWSPELPVCPIALSEDLLPDADEVPNGPELHTSGTPQGRRSEASTARLQTSMREVRSNLGDEAASAAGQPAPEAVFTSAENASPATPLLTQAALEPGLNLSVLARSAHIVIGTEDGRSLELHLRLAGDRTEIRAAGALAHVIRARLAELELVLIAQGVPLAGFEVTDDEEGTTSDADDEPADAGRRRDISRVFRTKA